MATATSDVLYLCDRISLRGGADQHLLQVISWAAEAGQVVAVAAGRMDADVPLPSGVTPHRVRGLASPLSSASRLGRLDELLERARLVHVQNVMNPRAVRRAVESAPTIVTVQDHRVFCPGMGKTLPDGSACAEVMGRDVCAECLPDPDYRARMLELTRLRLDAIRDLPVLVLSEYMARELRALGVSRVEVLPPWVAPSRRTVDAERRRRGFVVGGRLVRHKGTLDAHRAWREAATDHPLLVAGSGPLAAELTGASQLGWLGQDRLRALLRDAVALLFPARWQEPFGILGVEALAEGTPAVVAATGGTSDWSDAGCLVVPPGDVRAMADAIRSLAADPELVRRLGAAGSELVRRRFGRRRVEERLASIYSDAGSGARPPGGPSPRLGG